jgi:subtilisin family serine protease
MKKVIRNPSFWGRTLLFASAAFLYSCAEEPSANTSDEITLGDASAQVIPGQYIVVFNQGKTGNASSRTGGDAVSARQYVRSMARQVMEENGLSEDAISDVFAMSINGFAANLSAADLSKVMNDDRVAYVEQDRVFQFAPPPGKGPGGGGSTGQTTPWGIDRVGGFVNYTGSNVAWVIDTGIDLTHPDLNVDATKGFTAFTSGRDANLNDGNGHGTHVAGTIAAINNDIGVVGVAAGAPVVPVKVLDSRGSGSYSGVIAGVDHVAANAKNGDVANMSLGGPASQALDDAVLAASSKGIKFILAAGNDGKFAGNYSPARVNGTNIYTISAMNSSDTFASWSNWGNPPVDYCAPGVSINSTWKDGGYNTISGTSMAAPHAAGVLLLGNAKTSGYVKNDPDGNPDPIISR